MKLRAFSETYLDASSGRVLDVGSQSYDASQSFRSILPQHWSYTGLDIAAGPNVDLVPKHPFLWDEIESSRFDACITGQTFEHNPLFWVTLAEMARVTKPGGLIFVVAPGKGPVHRYPVDCWRFYPDCWAALAAYTGLVLLESEFDEASMRLVESGSIWCDSAAIFRRPKLGSSEQEAQFAARLDAIRETARAFDKVAAFEAASRGATFRRYQDLLNEMPASVRAYKYVRRFGNWRRVLQRLFVEA